MRAAGFSDVGRVRTTNEDTFVVDPTLRLFAVADGMGGHGAGEVASGLAIEALTGFVSRSSSDTDFSWPYGLDGTLSFDGNRLKTAIHLANRRVFRAAESNDDYSGMGTTLVGMLVNGSHVIVGHVGDSRLYLLRGGAIEQKTEDDSWVATILARDPAAKGVDLSKHPMRNVLTSAIGARDQVEVHIAEIPVTAGDTLLLCSDGLHGSLGPQALQSILDEEPDVQAAAQRLVISALDAGSRDNVTALVVRID
jgi:protein phosphatase